MAKSNGKAKRIIMDGYCKREQEKWRRTMNKDARRKTDNRPLKNLGKWEESFCLLRKANATKKQTMALLEFLTIESLISRLSRR